MRAFILVAAATLLWAANASAAGDCCGSDACCAQMACCRQEALAPATPDVEPAAARESAKVTFVNPVKVGDRVLMGTYIIEHDMARMAAGQPCTHIYKADDQRLPVVAFHCVHLNRTFNEGPTAAVTLRRLPEAIGIFELLEFQFAGSADGHGVPVR